MSLSNIARIKTRIVVLLLLTSCIPYKSWKLFVDFSINPAIRIDKYLYKEKYNRNLNSQGSVVWIIFLFILCLMSCSLQYVAKAPLNSPPPSDDASFGFPRSSMHFLNAAKTNDTCNYLLDDCNYVNLVVIMYFNLNLNITLVLHSTFI